MQASRKTANPRRRRKDRETMENNRIRKLLTSEYREFLDTILVESPFAETMRNGQGIRQVSLGLTPFRLIVAADVMKKNCDFFCPRDLDPSIETFELISVYPLEYVTLSVFSRRRRKTLKARFIDGKVNYYELGGMHRKCLLWKTWCEQVEVLLAKKAERSSLSETTAASSSSSSTLYVLSSEMEIRRGTGNQRKKTVCRVWAHYGGAGDYVPPTWPQKDLYLGPSHNDLTSGRYIPVPIKFAGGSLEDVKDELKDFTPKRKPCQSWPVCQTLRNQRKHWNTDDLCDILFVRDHDRRRNNVNRLLLNSQSCPCNNCRIKIQGQSSWYQEVLEDSTNYIKQDETIKCPPLMRKVSRFGFGVPEKCRSGLVLGPCRRDRDFNGVRSKCTLNALMENGVKVWENERKNRRETSRNCRHIRRYGICTAPHFLHAMGPWTIQPGERNLFQGRRSFSLVTIRRQPLDPELKLPVSRRQLGASVSCTALEPGKFGGIGSTGRGRVVLFWTPEYWYRPRPAAAAYRELRQHLTLLRHFRQEKESTSRKTLFYKRKKYSCERKESFLIAEEKPSLLGRIFSTSGTCKKKRKEYERNDNTTQLRRLLRMDFRITIWDLDSTTLSTQLTMIDRDLFMRIPVEEIQILVFQKTPRNAPNLGAWIAFGHRISCLTVSEILAVRKLEMRSRIIARFINTANKCFAMGNFHSCRSILAGLQAPAIYRLCASWSYLRTHHATRYEIMERLCKIYKTTCSSIYRRFWIKAEGNPPLMPYVGDILTRLLNRDDLKRSPKLIERPLKKEIKVSDRLLMSNVVLGNKNKNNGKTEPVNINNLEQKHGLGKRIFISLLTKIKIRENSKSTSCKEKKDLLWTSGEQDLANKYYYRWKNVVLKSKILAKEKERLRKMDPRKKRVLDVASWLLNCQKLAQGYDFPGHSFAREFLLKARYREDRENFFISLELEPSKVT